MVRWMVSGSMRWIVLMVACVAIVGCDKDDSRRADPAAETAFSLVQVINAMVDAPALVVTFDFPDDAGFEIIELTTIEAFRQISPTNTIEVGTATLNVTHTHPITGLAVTLIPDTSVSFGEGMIHIVVLTGTYDDPSFQLFVKELGDLDDVDVTDTELQIINISAVAADVYLEDPDSTTGAPRASLAAGASTDPFRLDADPVYEFYVTTPGEATRLYDAGTAQFFRRSRAMLVVHDDPRGPGVAAFIAGQSGVVLEQPNLAAGPRLRFTNLWPDESVGVEIREPFADTLIRNLTVDPLATSDYVAMDADTVFYEITVTPASPVLPELRSIISLDEDSYYTFAIHGDVADGELTTRSFTVDERPVSTTTNVQFINGAKLIQVIDQDTEVPINLSFYLLSAGESIDDSPPVSSNIGFLRMVATRVAAEPAVLVVTTTGTRDIVAGPTAVQLDDKASVLISIAEAPGGGTPLQVTISTRGE